MISVVLALFGSHRVAELLGEEGQIEHQCRQMSCMNQSCFLHSLEMQSVTEHAVAMSQPYTVSTAKAEAGLQGSLPNNKSRSLR